MGDLEATLEQQLGDVAKAELVAQPPEHGEEHGVGWILQIVERCSGPLVEDPAACLADERAVPQGASPSPPAGRSGAAVRTVHGQVLSRSLVSATLAGELGV